MKINEAVHIGYESYAAVCVTKFGMQLYVVLKTDCVGQVTQIASYMSESYAIRHASKIVDDARKAFEVVK
jgi:hypothetical protein